MKSSFPENNNDLEKNLSSRLRHKVDLEEELISFDDTGGIESLWQKILTIHAEIMPIKGEEMFSSMQLDNSITHIITIRYIPNINNKMRIRYKNRLFNIKSIINPLEQSIILEISAEEGGLSQ